MVHLCKASFEVSDFLRQSSILLHPRWVPGELNTEADDWTNQKFDSFNKDLRAQAVEAKFDSSNKDLRVHAHEQTHGH